MSELDMVYGAVLATLGGEAVKTALTPVSAYRQHLHDRMVTRLDRARRVAEARKGGELTINDRVAFKALMEAAVTDDEVTSEYLGGVLAASEADDDAGAAVVAQIGRMSSLQLRLHYVVYREFGRLWPDSVPLNLHEATEARRGGLRFSGSDLVSVDPGLRLVVSLIPPLVREGLLADRWNVSAVDSSGNVTVEVRPSGPGLELFLWGHGVAPTLEARVVTVELLTEVPATPQTKLLTPPTGFDEAGQPMETLA